MSELRALLMIDVVDSTRIAEAIGDAAMTACWVAHDRAARDLLRTWRGRELEKTDGVKAVFDSAADAAGFAVDYHRALVELGLPFKARAGLHVGAMKLRENSAADVAGGAKRFEVDGLGVAIAARAMAVALGGQTLLTNPARGALGATALRVQSHGFWRLKGVHEPVELFEVGDAQAPFTPPPDEDKAYRVVRIDELWQPLREVRHNLPPDRDAFVGRTTELQTLAQELQSGSRLVNLLGPGGIGKTRLVRRYAMAWLGEWPGGVYFCDLSEARTLDGIYFAVGLALGVPLHKDDPAAQLGHAIAGRGRSLVILDNFEQVQQHAAASVAPWLDRAAQAAFVVTSRERLHVAGEVVLAVEPLRLDREAIELFAVRARAQRPEFELDDGNRHAVAEVVRLLDGLPLAIELAAARVRVLSPAQIVLRLNDRFVLLAGAKGATARQATLRAAIDWSWELLAPWEQIALAQCSVFEGGFTLEAAESVLDLRAWPEAAPAMDAIQALVDKSLLRAWRRTAAGRLDIAEPYFGMYLSIHEYASQKLHALGEETAGDAEQRHGRYFAGFGSDAALDAVRTHGGVARRHMLARELDNLVSACRRAIRRNETELSAACFLAASTVLEAQGPVKLAATLGRQVSELDGLAPHQSTLVQLALADALRAGGEIEHSDAVQARALAIARQSADRRTEAMALRHLAIACHRQGHNDEAQAHFDAALLLHELLNDEVERAALLANLANLQMELGQMTKARATYEAALALQHEIGNRAAEGVSLGNLGTLHHELGHVAKARAAYDAALLIHRESGNLLQEAITLYNLGILVSQQGAHHEAAAHYRAALKIHREIGNRRGEGVVLGQIGELHHALGEVEQAQAHYDAALRIHREVGNRRFEGGILGNLGELLADQGQIEPGLQRLEAGERLLRDVDDPLDLAKLLCGKGRAALAGGNYAMARSALTEAESISAELGAEPESDLGRMIERLRQALR